MMTTWRIGLCVGLAILGGRTVADAQTQLAVGAADRQWATASRAGSSAAVTPATAAARRSTAASYNRLTSTSRRSYAYSEPRGAGAGIGPGMYAAEDPLRPYSAQARKSAAMSSPTRLSEAPPPPPRVAPPARYDYYPNMRSGQHPNANRPHCTPSRGGVLAGSVGRGR